MCSVKRKNKLPLIQKEKLPLLLMTFFNLQFQGGDGLFNEILNGILSSRYKASYPPTPEGFRYFGSNENCEEQKRNGLNCSMPTPDSVNTTFPGNSTKCDDHEPLLSTSQPTGLEIPSLSKFLFRYCAYVLQKAVKYFGGFLLQILIKNHALEVSEKF